MINPKPADPVLTRVDRSVEVKKDSQTPFQVAVGEGVTPGNLFRNQLGTTHQSTKGAIVETKNFVSRNWLMYFMIFICERVSCGVTKKSRVPTMLLALESTIRAFKMVICNLGSNVALNQSCKSHRGPKRRYFLLVLGRCFSLWKSVPND